MTYETKIHVSTDSLTNMIRTLPSPAHSTEQAPRNQFQISCRDKVLVMSVEMFSSSSQAIYDGNSNLEESELVTDIQTVLWNSEESNLIVNSGANVCNVIREQISHVPIVKTFQDCLYRGRIDIILHPIFQVPCPYIQLFNSSGQPVTANCIQLLIRNYKLEKSLARIAAQGGGKDKNKRYLHDFATYETAGNEDNLKEISPKVDNYLEYLFEEHPYTLTPCLCLHVCGLGASLALIDTPVSSLYNGCDSSIKQNCVGDKDIKLPISDLYLLSWFTLVGPAIGIDIDLSFYQLASKML